MEKILGVGALELRLGKVCVSWETFIFLICIWQR